VCCQPEGTGSDELFSDIGCIERFHHFCVYRVDDGARRSRRREDASGPIFSAIEHLQVF
jgi:hypothetical protein